ncbi:MAG: putative toxin-antitoxin system toxin component, PIN family [Nitrospirae bacterium]|nr:putative toxin-antitoxin system toxin component, PIN family [Nitrospirota bacterium]
MRVVLDTNILVSGIISPAGPPAQILTALRQGRVVAVMSAATLAELEAVLQRPRFRPYFVRAGVTPAALLNELRLQADIVTPAPSVLAIRDERDRPFLDLMGTTPPPEYFVTGDHDFEARQYSGVPVVSASLFVQLLKQL